MALSREFKWPRRYNWNKNIGKRILRHIAKIIRHEKQKKDHKKERRH
jgi:hypothetical protein